jgi:uncharacterized protein YjbI with pentapeptide repeats
LEDAASQPGDIALNQEGQITDRFARAVELLGTTDDEGGSRLQTRLGGIFALERIGVDSSRDRPQVIDILTTYVLINARQQQPPEPSATDDVPRYAGGDVPSARLIPDIQAILTVLCRLVPASPHSEPLDLSKVDLRGARLNGAHFAGIDLTDSWLDDASLREADFAGAKLRRAFLTKSDLSQAVFEGASMEGITLKGALVWRANLRNADLGPSPHWTGPGGPDLSCAILDSADLGGADLSGAKLRDADVTFASFQGARFVKATLDGIHGEGANFRGSDMTGASLQGAKLPDSGFHQVNLTGAKMTHADINGWLTETDFTDADLRWTCFSGSNFDGAKLGGADLRNADLYGAVDLTWDQLRNARLDGAILPPYLSPSSIPTPDANRMETSVVGDGTSE